MAPDGRLTVDTIFFFTEVFKWHESEIDFQKKKKPLHAHVPGGR